MHTHFGCLSHRIDFTFSNTKQMHTNPANNDNKKMFKLMSEFDEKLLEFLWIGVWTVCPLRSEESPFEACETHHHTSYVEYDRNTCSRHTDMRPTAAASIFMCIFLSNIKSKKKSKQCNYRPNGKIKRKMHFSLTGASQSADRQCERYENKCTLERSTLIVSIHFAFRFISLHTTFFVLFTFAERTNKSILWALLYRALITS